MLLEHSKKINDEGLESLREAQEFAEWSYHDRKSRVPALNEEQYQQLQQYLQMTQDHAVDMLRSQPEKCHDCPIMKLGLLSSDTTKTNSPRVG